VTAHPETVSNVMDVAVAATMVLKFMVNLL
jgi:hypothetical protein